MWVTNALRLNSEQRTEESLEDLLLGDDPLEVSTLTDAVRRHTARDAARAALIYADGAPADRVAAAEARLRALDLQKVTVRKVE
jgi:hypothetical protein